MDRNSKPVSLRQGRTGHTSNWHQYRGGEPKCCKSFLALDLAVAVAGGVPCLRCFAVPDPGRVLLYADKIQAQGRGGDDLDIEVAQVDAGWHGVSLAELIRRELAPYTARSNTELSGPEVVLRAEAGQAMAMVLHELTTNAAKYGALSSKNGRVSIRWDWRLNGHPAQLMLEWQEFGGPPVTAPGNPSYGTSTILDLIPYEFGGTVDLVFAPEGVRCRLELPADWLSKADARISEGVATSGL